MAYYLGIDIGTSGTKTICIDQTGQILGQSTVEYDVSMPKPMWTEQHPDLWWEAVKSTVVGAIKASKMNGKKISGQGVKAIGLSGQMHGSVFLDAKQKVLRPALLWNDQRTAKECAQITDLAGGRDALIEMVANPALTGFTAPKLLWLQNNEPKKYEKLRHLLLPKDEIRRRLTGELATEVSDASGMLLLDVVNRKWSDALLGKLQIDKSILAKVYESEDVTGTLRAEIASELGLNPACKVVGGAGDCAAGAIGNGVVKAGIVAASLGTSGVMFCYSDQPQYDRLGRLHTFCHAVRGKWHMMGVTLSAAGSWQWFMSTLCHDLAKAKGLETQELLNQEAAAATTGSQGLFFLPYLAGERTPHADANARGCWIGLTGAHKRGDLARSVMEGVAYSLRDCLEIIRSLDVPVNQMRVGGGGAKSGLWKQILADSLHQPACTINTEQGAAFGVALLAAVGDGAYKNIQEACQATIRVVEKVAVKKTNAAVYDQAYPIYQSLYQSLKRDFEKIAHL